MDPRKWWGEDLSEVSLEEALAALAKYSMVKWTDGTNASVQVHRLVQEITRGRLAEGERLFWLEQALQLVDAALPSEPPPPRCALLARVGAVPAARGVRR